MDKQIIELAKGQNILDPAALLAFIQVETGGMGFDKSTGKLLIQFEPAYFRKKEPFAPSGQWSVNKVDIQSREWTAFNDAFAIDPNAAMESTSIGLGQIMGLHWERLHYGSVGQMWDDAKRGIIPQIAQIMIFIETDTRLKEAIITKDWNRIASIYNGAGYKALAERLGREPYDLSLQKAFDQFKSIT